MTVENKEAPVQNIKKQVINHGAGTFKKMLILIVGACLGIIGALAVNSGAIDFTALQGIIGSIQD